MAVYGYCRISTNKQNIERQVRNITEQYPNAIIIKEQFTGKKTNRPKFNELLKIIKDGDTIVFDSVSRMSRNSKDGIKLYQELMSKNINLVFIKEPHINTDTYKNALQSAMQIPMTGTLVDCILEGVNEYMRRLAETQIEYAFQSAQAEVDELAQRTKEGLLTAKLDGKRVGNEKGTKLTTQKSIKVKEIISKYNKAFNGTLTDEETIALIKGSKYEYVNPNGVIEEKSITGLSRGTYYKYKAEIQAEIETELEEDYIDYGVYLDDSIFEDD